MAITTDEYLTVSEAATLLKVSQSTIWRWIKRSQLPAYRVGQRRIRVKKQDLAQVVAPVAQPAEMEHIITSWEEIRALEPISEERRQRMFAAAGAARRLHATQLAERGGKPFSNSWELINEARDERTRQLDEHS